MKVTTSDLTPWQGGASPLSDAEVWVRAASSVLAGSLVMTGTATELVDHAARIADLVVLQYRKRAALTAQLEVPGGEG